MRLSRERIAFLAKAVIDGLLREQLISHSDKNDDLAHKIEAIILEELMIEDRLNAEVDKLLKSYESEIEKGNVDYRKMFQMVKNQLVKERGIVL